MRISSLTPLLIISGCAATPEQAGRAAAAQADTQAALAAELAGLTPGEPTDCLPIASRPPLSSKGFGATIVYRASRNLKYVTETTGCYGVGRNEDILVTSTPIGRTCRGDIAQTFDRTSRIPTGSCSFGSFTPYRRP